MRKNLEQTLCTNCGEWIPVGQQWIEHRTICLRPKTIAEGDPSFPDRYVEAFEKALNSPEWKAIQKQAREEELKILMPGLGITIYLSGPMSGYPDFNSATFKKYAEKYRAQGFTVKSPPELDAESGHNKSYEFYMRRDVRVLLEDGIDRVYLLPDWQKSRGSNLEVHLAKMFNIPLYNAETGEPWEENCAQEAMRLVFGDRRESYSNPLSDFGRTKGILNSVFSHKLKIPFTEQDVAIMMIAVKLSRLTNKPDHRDSLVDLCGYALCYEWVAQLVEEAKCNVPNAGIPLSSGAAASTAGS